MADGTILQNISSADLYSLFGNILDNAMESVLALQDLDRRIISLTVQKTGNLALIHAENYYEHPLNMKKGMLQTTKPDPRYHGLGLKSIRLLAGNLADPEER